MAEIKSSAVALPFKDDPDVREIFADGLQQAIIDDSGLRLVFAVNRPELPVGGGKKLGGYRTVAARINMPQQGLTDLYTQLDEIVKKLEAMGLLKRPDVGGKPTVQ